MNHLASVSHHGALAAAASAFGAFAAASIAIIVIAVLLVIALIALMLVSGWKVFRKAGKPGWASLVPFYNIAVMLDFTGKPLWWTILFFVPIANLIVGIIVLRRVAAVFGKGAWFTVGLLFLPFIFWPILAFGKSQYTNAFPPAAPMGETTKWALIAFLAAAVLHASAFEAFGKGFAEGALLARPLTNISADLGYATDGRYVYYQDEPVLGADPASFSVPNNAGTYALDDAHVYSEGNVVASADPVTFEEYVDDSGTGTGYGHDADHVFDGAAVIPGADPKTFAVLQYGYSKDANHVYYQKSNDAVPNDQIVEGADPATFVVDLGGSDSNPYDAHDANRYYDYGDPLTVGK